MLHKPISSTGCYQVAKQFTQKQADGVRMRITRLFELAKIATLDDITESRVQVALAGLRLLPKSKKQTAEEMPLASPRTRNTYLHSVRSFCRWMTRNKRIPDNPLSAMEIENEELDVRHARTSLTDEEFARLLTAASNSSETVEGFDGKTRAMAYLITVSTGLRRKELASLTPESFRLDGSDPLAVVEAAFSKHRRRDEVRFPMSLLPALQSWLATIKPGEPVLPKLATRKTHKMIRHDLKTAGIAYRTADGRFRDWHALRHTFVTRAWRSGAQPNVVKDLARHSDIRETLAYSHSTQADLRRAVNNIPDLPVNGTHGGRDEAA